jgi:ABC-type branched-subunit amino acid transport system substrate-binding protein
VDSQPFVPRRRRRSRPRRRTASVLAVAACGLAALLSACGSSSSSSGAGSAASASGGSSAAHSPIQVLWLGDTTGPEKAIGLVQQAGLKGAIAYFNARGGADGHHIDLTTVSENSDTGTASSELISHLQSGTPTMVVPGGDLSINAALIPVLAKRNVFAIAEDDGESQCATDAATKCPNTWTQADPPATSTLPAATWLHAHHITKVGILAEEIDFAQAEGPAFLKAIGKYGISHVTATFPDTSVDLTPQVQQLKAAGAQAIFVQALGSPAGFALKARASLGWHAPMIFDIAASSLDLTKLVPPAEVRDHVYEDIFRVENPSDPSPAIPLLLKLGGRYGPITSEPIDDSALAWDYIVNLNDVIKAANGKTDIRSLDAAALKMPATDPLRMFTRKLAWSSADHENVDAEASDYEIVPAGPIIKGQVHSY